jgi:hypothetical protein
MFSTKEVSELCGLPEPVLWNWLRQKWLIPAGKPPDYYEFRTGRPPHYFTGSQAFALAILGYCQAEAKRCGSRLSKWNITKIMDPAIKVTDDKMRVWLKPESTRNSWEQEIVATWRPIGVDAQDLDPDLLERLNRVVEAIREKLALAKADEERLESVRRRNSEVRGYLPGRV